MRWRPALSIQTDYTTLTAELGRRAHSHREALSFAAFLDEKVWLGLYTTTKGTITVLLR